MVPKPKEHNRQTLSDDGAIAEELASLKSQVELLESKYASLKNHTRGLVALGNVASDMIIQDSLDALLQLLANEIVNLTSANGAYLHMVHETRDYLLVVASCGKYADQLMGNTRKRGVGLSAKAWVNRSYQYTENYNKDYKDVTVFAEELKAVAIPLGFSGKISGVAFVTSDISEDLYSQIPLLEEIGKIASLAIYCAEQLESQRNELQRIKTLSVLGNVLYQSTDWEIILNKVSEYLFEIFDIDRVSIYQESPDNGRLSTHVVHERINNIIESRPPSKTAASDESIVHWCYTNNQFAQINRHIEDPRESAEVHEFLRANEIGSTMCIPVSYDGKPWAVFIINKHENKRDFSETDANAFHAVASQLSTALQRNNLLSEVQHQAYHDSLTGLPNRRSFEQYFAAQVDSDSKDKFAILFCDLDGFKTINDTYGHDTGDTVLNICACRMSSCIRSTDYLARMGGDEFAILVKLSETDWNIDTYAKQFVKILSEAIHTNDLRLHLSASIGISFYPEDGSSFSELLNHAGVAMYQAKHSGKGKVLYFNKKDAEEIRAKNKLRTDLLSALPKNEFELWYQPQVCWENTTVTGVEALIRWNHPNGSISPFVFIPIAEESGFIDPLGMWVMEEAISSLSSGALSPNPNLQVGVNIAPPQFLDPNFSSNILALLKKYDVDPSLLKVEITESFIMHEREKVVMHLKNLRDNGVQVAIDDFGTGYSSLSYLQDLPVDVLKIDRLFVNALTESNYEKSIAASIIALANSLELSTITEGVETEEQLGFIQNLGCKIIQGYYYSKPVPAAELPAAIEAIESLNRLPIRKSA